MVKTIHEIDSAFQQQINTMIPRYKTLNLELKTTKMLLSGLEESIKKNEKVVEEKDQQI